MHWRQPTSSAKELRMTAHRSLVSFGVFLLSLSLLAGCRISSFLPAQRSMPTSVDTATPLIAGERGQAFYPLVLGNRWHYARTYDVRVEDSTAPRESHFVSTIERELMCETPLGPRSYTAERSLEVLSHETYTSWVYYRQDRFGLYEADDPTPPPCAAPPPPEETGPGLRARPLSSIAERGRLPEDADVQAAVLSQEQRLALIRYSLGLPAPSMRRPRPAVGEIVRLAYPMHTGQRWIIRAEPRFTSHVEGVDALHLPAGHFVAYRIRIESELFGPNDSVLVWYGREGFLRLDAHIEEIEGRDESGHFRVVTTDDHEVLDGIALGNTPPD
jgi:hypothetical protein